jgi:hypothetical protein
VSASISSTAVSGVRRAAGIAAVLVLAGAASCTFDEITIAKTTPTVVVHSVLNLAAPNQLVLLERTLTGALTVTDSIYDPTDPIASLGGIPITGAVVEITDSTGRVFRGEEQTAAAGNLNGVYIVPLAAPVLRGGARYELHVHTAAGETVTAETRVPNPPVTSEGGLSQVFNRDHDTLRVDWPRTAGARTYGVRVESPYGPYFLFSDSTRVRLPGDARNLFSSALQHLFIPGFRQDLVIVAVDSNFYDYYRTRNDPFTGSGIISRIDGGLGLFGSTATLASGTLSVTADQTDPIEGRFRLSSASDFNASPVASLTLYVESKSTRSDVPDVLSGRFTAQNTGASGGILGEQTGSTVTLAFVGNQLAGDTLDVFEGVLADSVLSGRFRSRSASGRAVFVKR